jgi:hypothetical protein
MGHAKPSITADVYSHLLEDLVASHPDLLGLAGADDDTDIEGPFRAFTQDSLRALNGRMIAPDLADGRYYTVVGLAQITGESDWRPTMEQFRTNENKYLDHWR